MTALSLWNEGATKSAITDFVARVTEDGGSDYVEPAARVAVFDNDGTLSGSGAGSVVGRSSPAETPTAISR